MSVFHNWLLEIACENYFVYIKRLSANDTGATGGHQVGLYIPSGIVEKLFPSINHTRELNPSVFLTAHVSSHDCPDSEARAIYYNSRHWHCCKVSDEAAFCLIQRPYISKTLLTRRISPRGSP
ncbi:hypothetical protein CLI88_26625 (plasmid) [Klebsiella pneumoniae]|nr:hypothetical protein CLI88_26625 [Klebsiella pneumoniae]